MRLSPGEILELYQSLISGGARYGAAGLAADLLHELARDDEQTMVRALLVRMLPDRIVDDLTRQLVCGGSFRIDALLPYLRWPGDDSPQQTVKANGSQRDAAAATRLDEFEPAA